MRKLQLDRMEIDLSKAKVLREVSWMQELTQSSFSVLVDAAQERGYVQRSSSPSLLPPLDAAPISPLDIALHNGPHGTQAFGMPCESPLNAAPISRRLQSTRLAKAHCIRLQSSRARNSQSPLQLAVRELAEIAVQWQRPTAVTASGLSCAA